MRTATERDTSTGFFLPTPGWEDQRQHAQMLDVLYEVVFTTDGVGNWTYLNAAWQRLCGEPPAHALGRSFMEYVHPDEQEAVLEMFRSVVSGERDHCHHDGRWRHADGSWRWVEIRARAFYDDSGLVVANAGTLLDITERRHAEHAAEQARRRLAEATEAERRGIAAELHADTVQLISAASWQCELAAELEDPEARSEAISEALASLAEAERACRMLTSRLMPGELLANTSLAEAISLNAARLETRCPVVLDLDLPHRSYPPTVRIVVFRVVQEALRNAVRHAKPDHIWVRLHEDEGHITGSVRDDGVGFDPAQLGQRLKEGHIGVASMREMVASAGGVLTLGPNQGRGTVVNLTVPVLEEDPGW